MNECPHCHSALGDGARPAACARCGHKLGTELPGIDDTWEAIRLLPGNQGDSKPIIGGPVESVPEGRSTTTGELLRSLLAVAAARTERGRSERPPPAPQSTGFGLDYEEVGATNAYGAQVGRFRPASAGAASITMGNEPTLPQQNVPIPETPPPETNDGIIARALESLCTRVHSHERGVACVVDLLTLVASADGVIDDAEMDALSSSVGVLLGGVRLPKYMRLLVQSSVDEIHKVGAAETMLGIAEVLSETDAVEDGLVMAVAVAYASYGMCPPERATIRALAGVAGVASERCEEIIRQVRAEVDPAWESVAIARR